MDNTKKVSEIMVSKEICIQQDRIQQDRIQQDKIQDLIGLFDTVWDNFDVLFFDKHWIKIDNYAVYYNREFNILIPDPDVYKISSFSSEQIISKEHLYSSGVLDYESFTWSIPDLSIVRRIAEKDVESPYFQKYPYLMYKTGNRYFYIGSCDHINGKMGEGLVKVCCLPISQLENDIVIKVFLKYGLIPSGLSLNDRKLYEILLSMYQKDEINIGEKTIQLTKVALDKIYSGLIFEISGVSFIPDKKEIQSSNYTLSWKDNKDLILKYYLECDKKRADMDSYEMIVLEEPQKGHWDLWESEVSDGYLVKIDTELVARNPVSDINQNGIVGIDFGTKSTIVAYQNGCDVTQLMRIGKGKISKEVKDDDFENPTVIQFRDIKRFMNKYNKVAGRPDTEWNDLTISYTAQQSLLESDVNRSEFHSFMYDLKQWAGNRTGCTKLKDIKGTDINLSAFLSLDENAIDPIELYAYYIGLYINNMRNGIYLKYLLSFPVSYDKASRERILLSFKKGIMKSFPGNVLKNKEIMDEFSVKQGASEPAAYAVCALQQYGFEPKNEDDEIFYGVFDFGGGTTDYDFGLWKYADADDEIFDYTISHFGSGSDKYLGGENLLERLAYEVFVDNISFCRKNDIVFQKPSWMMMPEEIKYFINESQEARINTKILIEQLRPFWEGERKCYSKANVDGKKQGEGYVEEKTETPFFEDGEIKITLFDRNGTVKTGQCLKVNKEKLEEILFSEIEKGVINFFEALNNAFVNYDLNRVENIHIFLAGNSSKSPLVKKAFDIHINKEVEKIETVYKKLGRDVKKQNLFLLYPPLGTQEARKMQKEMGIAVDKNIRMPTGKTGVAYGLLEVRSGNGIKVIEEVSFDKEAKFKYYLGIKKRRKFVPKIFPETEYGKWIRFVTAAEETFELYYCTLPGAVTGNMDTADASVRYKICGISIVDVKKNIYIRLLDPVTLEYAVGVSEDEIDSNTIRKICFSE